MARSSSAASIVRHMAAMAAELGIDRTNVANVLTRLAARGLVKRGEDPRDRRVKTALQMARVSAIKTLAGFDFAFQASLDKNRIMALAELQFIDRAEAVHLIGPPGTGKTHLSLALGVEAIKAGRSVYFGSLTDIVAALARAEREGALRENSTLPIRSIQQIEL